MKITDHVLKAIAEERALLANIDLVARRIKTENPALPYAKCYEIALEKLPVTYEAALAAGLRARRSQ
jgi:hypothetical protein